MFAGGFGILNQNRTFRPYGKINILWMYTETYPCIWQLAAYLTLGGRWGN